MPALRQAFWNAVFGLAIRSPTALPNTYAFGGNGSPMGSSNAMARTARSLTEMGMSRVRLLLLFSAQMRNVPLF